MRPLEKMYKEEFILDLTGFLIEWGINPKDAMKMSESFYRQWKKKLKSII